ncbi:hypothetical protein EVC28_028 [Rhizobium phage RHph_I1_23]|nr:hypothetical protein EVC28_028 [Rhizobium phage RHph_I1_23]
MSDFVTPETQPGGEKIYIDRKSKYNQMVEVVPGGVLNSLSRGAPSTTRPPLRCGPDRRNHLVDQEVFRDFRRKRHFGIMQVLAAENGTSRERVGTYGTNLAQSGSPDVPAL